MPRQARKESGTGINLVVLRGINRQDIFEEAEDNYQVINTLDRMRKRSDTGAMMKRTRIARIERIC